MADELELMRALILVQQSMIMAYESSLDCYNQTLYQIGDTEEATYRSKRFEYGIIVRDIKKLLLDDKNQLFDVVIVEVYDDTLTPLNTDQYKLETVISAITNSTHMPHYFYKFYVNNYNIILHDTIHLILLNKNKSYGRDPNDYNIENMMKLIQMCQNLVKQDRLSTIKPLLY